MFCHKCGAPVFDDAEFCGQCGTKTGKTSNKNKYVPILALIGILVMVFIGVMVACFMMGKSDYEDQISLGDKYLKELNYKDAILAYQKAIEIEPKAEGAYIRLSDLYIEQGDYDNALNVIETAEENQVNSKQTVEQKERIQTLLLEETSEEKTEEEKPEREYQIKVETLYGGEYVTVEYPVITCNLPSEGVDIVNSIFLQEAQEKVNAEQGAIDETARQQIEYGYSERPEYTVTCEQIYQEGDIVSVAFYDYLYACGPHPYQHTEGESYELLTGKALSIGELLHCSDDEARECAVRKFDQMLSGKVEDVTEEKIRNTINEASYWMTQEGVKIELAQYSVASYAAGAHEVLLTQEDISVGSSEAPILKNNFTEDKIKIIQNIEADASDFIFPYSRTQLLTDTDLKILEADTTVQEHSNSQMAINEILARYGFTFNPNKSDTAKEAFQKFNSLDWYQQAKPYCPYTAATEMVAHLNDIEKANVNKINEWQKVHGCYY